MNIYLITILVIQFILNVNALKFSELKGINNDQEEESFSKYENTCVYISELPPLGMNKRNPTTDFMNLMHEKYGPEGLKVIGFLRRGYYLVQPDVYKFEMYVESSVDNLNSFLKQSEFELTRSDNFLIENDGETIKNYKETVFNNKPPGIFGSINDMNGQKSSASGKFELIKKEEKNIFKKYFKKLRDLKTKRHLIGFFDELFNPTVVKKIEKDIRNCLKKTKINQEISISEKKFKEKQD